MKKALFTCLFIFQYLCANEFEVIIDLEKKEVPLSDKVKINVEMKYPKNYRPDIQQMISHLLNHDALSAPPFTLSSYKIDGNKIFFELEPQVPGRQFITFLNIPFLPENSTDPKINIVSDLIEINVSTTKIDENYQAKPADLLTFSKYLPVEMSEENKTILMSSDRVLKEAEHNVKVFKAHLIPWWPVLASLLVILFYFIIKNNKYIPSQEELINLRIQKAKKIAFQALNQLHSANLPKKGEYDPYYVQLTDILRYYLKNRYQFKKPFETTPQLIKEIEGRKDFKLATKKELSKLFIDADKVKFANYTPSTKEYKEAILSAYHIIESTP